MLDAAVLIAGAGPTGLATAITCRRFGLAPRLIDRAPAPAGVSKALAVWSASLEAFAAMGIADRFLAEARVMRQLRFGEGTRELAVIHPGEGVDSPYPRPILLPQSRTEALLAARFAELGGSVERGCELVALRQDEAGVSVTLRHADGREEQGRYAHVVGCDGARSTTRHALDVPFDGHTEPRTFLLCDAPIAGGLDPASVCIWSHDDGSVALFPVAGDTWRVFAVRAGDDETTPTRAEMQAQLDAHGPPGLVLGEPSWLSAFRINDRLARNFRVGRCFLAGDAAHIHSPAGGQGMNTGLQDGVNLGWKLAYARAGAPGAAMLLASYEPERRPVAQAVVALATRLLHVGITGGPLTHLARTAALPLLTRVPAIRRHMAGQLAETENVYREGPLVALGDGSARDGHAEVGERALDAELPAGGRLFPLLGQPRHALLCFGRVALPAALAEQAGDRLHAITLPAAGAAAERYRAQDGTWVLLRPDQVVAARGGAAEIEILMEYTAQVLARPKT